MDVQKSLSQRAFNLNKSAQKEYNTHAAHSSQTQLDAETFFALTVRKTATSGLFNEIGRLEHQCLKTTIDSFQ
ncbi:hypothetical protein IFR35_22630 [Pseudomonas fluorescens]|uniref:hypothetical protein n=1 Tax=Pseudomonas fluorescens TaxID=294 RepID=UPI001780EF3D|nr:hypothetical protein [Pseudomonas fluorescens]MBD8194197.1 hypothetical protein [Pseudomonas fluorescens]MBD8228994.1 hypothetical protein [Pseudomonas fluorescens]MBD8787007.1 hypothetical protein [Pseudomonas fluorescens]MBD8819159.1 hypothetical protein [Pseudomonas fluorescens]